MKNAVNFALAAAFFISAAANVATPSWLPPAKALESQAVAGEGAKVGAPAPDFELKDSHGKAHKLSDYKGKFIVLEWVNFGCPFVQKHYKSGNMPGLQEKYTKEGVVWLSICSSAPGRQGNFDDAKINELLKEHNSHTMAYLIDADGKVGRLYGAKATPTMFVIDKKGELVYGGAIDDKNTADEADIKTAKNYVAAALAEAKAGKPVTVAETTAYGCSVKYAK